MKMALILTLVNPTICGVVIHGKKSDTRPNRTGAIHIAIDATLCAFVRRYITTMPAERSNRIAFEDIQVKQKERGKKFEHSSSQPNIPCNGNRF